MESRFIIRLFLSFFLSSRFGSLTHARLRLLTCSSDLASHSSQSPSRRRRRMGCASSGRRASSRKLSASRRRKLLSHGVFAVIIADALSLHLPQLPQGQGRAQTRKLGRYLQRYREERSALGGLVRERLGGSRQRERRQGAHQRFSNSVGARIIKLDDLPSLSVVSSVCSQGGRGVQLTVSLQGCRCIDFRLLLLENGRVISHPSFLTSGKCA